VAAWAEKRRVEVGRQASGPVEMAYVERGEGAPIVLLHGNPTSSYLWRDVLPHLVDLGRCLVPDLVGMGDSSKLDDSGPDSYRFADHARYLEAFLAAVGVDGPATFVVHDWGSALGFDWMARHPGQAAAVAYMEAIVTPLTWDDWPGSASGAFQAFRSGKGEELVLERNFFVERVLPASVLRPLGEEEMAEYRRPFAEPGEGRRPTLTWPREIPLEGEPADVVAVVEAYGRWLASSPIPKLFVNADPGSILVGRQREVCRAWPNQVEVTVPGSHFVQEDSGDAIGRAVRAWYLERVAPGLRS